MSFLKELSELSKLNFLSKLSELITRADKRRDGERVCHRLRFWRRRELGGRWAPVTKALFGEQDLPTERVLIGDACRL